MHAGKRVQNRKKLLCPSVRLIGQKKHDKRKPFRCRAPEETCT